MAKKLDNFRRNVIITAVIAGVMILVANSAVWAYRYFINTDNFTKTAVTSLTSESSTDAMAGEIVDTALADYPVVKSVAGNTATNLVSGLLGSNQMQQVLDKVVAKLQVFLTSPQREPVVINLEGAKDVVNRLIDLSGREGETKINPDNVPDSITLFNPSNYPNFYNYGVALTWISPLVALGAVALLAWPYVKQRSRFKEAMVIQGLAVTLTGLLALLIGPLFKPVILGNVQSANLRVVVANLYDAFIATFNQQTYLVIGAGVLAVAVPVGIILFKKLRAR